uniref:Polypeptide N-acetylgalactosaminyltransferase n=1 Tax=Ascaris suum TaxID=6253 RepID=F1KY00_ASCSU
MRFPPYFISRRLLRIFQYGALVFSMLCIFFFLSPSFEKKRIHLEHQRGMLAGAFVGHQNKEMQAEDGADPFAAYKSLAKKDWHDYAAMENDKRRVGPGEGGKPVAIPTDPEIKKKQEELYRVNGYDAFVSDLIPLNRSVKDIRHKDCQNLRYLEALPSVSVIFPFHDEHNSTLLRSAYSVIARTPKEILKEIILVDDASTKPFLKKPLDEYLKSAKLDHIVKVVRTKKREGLIRARQIGAQHATADIMVFLDAHSEPNYNWLPPLIEPITLDYRTVVCPFVDVIDCDTFEYRAQDEGARGSFDWEFNYKRLPLTEDDLKHPTRPFKSPVMAGGYFAISRKWFWELGGYDEGLDIWGGEQYELSFKVWQCHGNMVDAPCSRVGHIYRCKHVPFPNPGVGDFISRNYKRVAEVWMDDYKKYLYQRRHGMENADEGDLTKQKAVRERLKCKSFDWFMKEIAFDQDKFYPAVEPEDSANGELRNVKAQTCVDTQFRGGSERFGLRKCISDDPSGGGEQNMRLTFSFDVRPKGRTLCFDVSSSVRKAPVVLFSCHGMQGNQLFKYLPNSKQMYHPVSNQCMDCDAERGEIFMDKCDEGKPTQQWVWTHFNITLIEERNAKAKL